MVRANGLGKILDIGIAKLARTPKANFGARNQAAETLMQSPPKNPQSTSPGVIVGTANYMSPEQAHGKDVDARTDIFSFGAVLYEMMAGNLPFEGETAIETIRAILHKETETARQDENSFGDRKNHR